MGGGSESAAAHVTLGEPVLVHGRGRLPLDVAGEVIDHLAAGVRVVGCDLSGLAGPAPAVAAHLRQVDDYLARWPGSALVLYRPGPAERTRITALGLGSRVLVPESLEAGVAAAQALLPVVRLTTIRLPPVPASAGQARAFIALTLQNWELPQLIEPASVVVSELATNVIMHAVTVFDVAVSQAEHRVRIAVRDRGGGRPVHAAERPATLPVDAGLGLRLVDAYAGDWGVFPARSAGKSVWVILDAAPSLPTRMAVPRAT
jgi:anti-sigma regulatory factor (Ser/Thr protein kinase)